MALVGGGALVIWHDIAAGEEDDFQDWHSHEHQAERVGLPGFRRGRRCEAIDGAPRYLILYEVDELATLISKPYMDRLNDPTPWTQRAVANFRNANRTLSAVQASHGIGVGAVGLPAAPGLSDIALERIATSAGMTGAHLLEGARAASGTETEEKRLRERPDEVSDWVLLIEGYDEAALARVRDDIVANIATEPSAITGGLYRLSHVVGADDLGT
jgi:hypothetical protein